MLRGDRLVMVFTRDLLRVVYRFNCFLGEFLCVHIFSPFLKEMEFALLRSFAVFTEYCRVLYQQLALLEVLRVLIHDIRRVRAADARL